MTDGRKFNGTATSTNSWSKAEKLVLLKYYSDPKVTWERLLEMLPRRTRDSIQAHATQKMNLHRRRTTKVADLKIIRRLWDLREREGIDRRQLGKRMGYHHGMLARWESGQTMPKVRHLIDWCEALGAELTVTYRGTPIEPTARDEDDDFDVFIALEAPQVSP